MHIKSILCFCALLAMACSESSDMASAQSGQGGSMARFAISGNFLYVLNNQDVAVFDITSPDDFSKLNEIHAGWGMETIFARGGYLYLGASDGMYIYSIADPVKPEFVFRYAHIVACDPVVVQGTRAYVTLRTGTGCNTNVNALDIIDITDPYAPRLITTFAMQNPHGLAVDGTSLFICEGEFGFKMFDISDENNIQMTRHVTNIFAYDVIARNGLSIVTGEDGIFQYQYPTPEAFTLVSTITVDRSAL